MKAIAFLLALMASVCVAQTPPPGLATSPAPAAAQKRQQPITTPDPQQGQHGNRQGRLHGAPKIEPPVAGGTVQPSPGRNQDRGQGHLGNGNSQGGGASLNANPNRKSKRDQLPYSDAVRRYRACGRHDRGWWKQHFTVIVLVGGGYYYFDNGFWCPAWGYDTSYQYYDYDGPIYTYGNLLPDQVISNVQRALKELGYYNGEITGSLKSGTREAISAYQEDNGLEITGIIDAATVAALGLD